MTNVFDISGEPDADAPPPDGASQAVPNGHEQVVFCHNKDAGLKAIIAVHNSVLGPALGGLRMWPYKSEAEALTGIAVKDLAAARRAGDALLAKGAGTALPSVSSAGPSVSAAATATTIATKQGGPRVRK